MLKFRLLDRQTMVTEAMTGSDPAPGRPGDQVRVRYDTTSPHRAHLADSLAQPSTINALHLVLGIGLMLAGLSTVGFWLLVVVVLKVPV